MRDEIFANNQRPISLNDTDSIFMRFWNFHLWLIIIFRFCQIPINKNFVKITCICLTCENELSLKNIWLFTSDKSNSKIEKTHLKAVKFIVNCFTLDIQKFLKPYDNEHIMGISKYIKAFVPLSELCICSRILKIFYDLFSNFHCHVTLRGLTVLGKFTGHELDRFMENSSNKIFLWRILIWVFL